MSEIIVNDTMYIKSVNGENAGTMRVNAEVDNASAKLVATFGGSGKVAAVNCESHNDKSVVDHQADFYIYADVLEYADNDAAIAAGLPIGTKYRTEDFLKIVH